MTRGHPELRRDLQQADQQTLLKLRARLVRRSLVTALRQGRRWFVLLPAGVLAFYLLQRLAGVHYLVLPIWLLVALALAPVAWRMAVAAWRTLASRWRPGAGLSHIDHELRLQGRLQAAHQFLGSAAPTSFMLAAIDDADAHVDAARRHQLQAAAGLTGLQKALLAPLLGIALLVLAVLLAPPELPAGATVVAEPPSSAPLTTKTPMPAPPPPPAANPAATPPKNPPDTTPQDKAAAGNEERKPSQDREQPLRESTGKSGQGAAANAETSGSTGDSKGFQSASAPPTEGSEPSKPNKKKPKPPKPSEQKPAPKKQLETSGATAGKGAGSGSNKNPSSTEWQSKDQVSTDEEPPMTDDQDVEEDTDESEARGGLQPSLRDRRPAVNRDLSIGFGNDPPPPDANGRGGPGEQKKSRGVASLVLGVPIPDHVKGQLNPGKIKITQERVEPRADEAQPIDADHRREREQPIGSFARPELLPWMQQLLQTYFLNLRTANERAK